MREDQTMRFAAARIDAPGARLFVSSATRLHGWKEEYGFLGEFARAEFLPFALRPRNGGENGPALVKPVTGRPFACEPGHGPRASCEAAH